MSRQRRLVSVYALQPYKLTTLQPYRRVCSAALLLEDAVTVGVEEVLKVGDLGAEFLALVGIGDEHAVGGHLDDLGGRLDIGLTDDGVAGGSERLVLYELETAGVVDEGVAGDAGLVVVGFRETAVDDHQPSACLDGVLALGGVDGHVAVDDVAVVAFHLEGVEDAVADLGGVAKLEVVALLFLVGLLVFEEIALEGGHLGLVEQWGILTAPEVEEVVAGIVSREHLQLFIDTRLKGCADHHADVMHQGLAAVTAAGEDLDLLERTVVVEGDGGVEEEVGVGHGVHAAVREKRADVLVKLLGDAEGVVELVHEGLFLRSQETGVRSQVTGVRRQETGVGRQGGEVAALHLVVASVDGTDATGQVDMLQQAAVVHLPLGMTADDLGLFLELDDGDGLVHLGGEQACLLVELLTVVKYLGDELLAGVVAVGLEGEGGQGHEVDAVLLDGGEVGIAQTDAEHVADAGVVAGGGTHPEDVVIAPLDVPRVILAQGVHDLMGARAAVVDVAEDMELVDGQALDHVADGHDEVVCPARGDDGVDDDTDVGGLVAVAQALVEQFLDDIGEVGREGLAHLRTGVLRRDVATDLHQLVDGDAIPVVEILLLGLDEFEFLLRVVDERAEFLLLRLADVVAEEFVHLALDVAGGVLQHVLEGLALAVEVGEEVLGALGQVHDGLEVDDLGGGLGDVGERLREQLEVVHVSIHIHSLQSSMFNLQCSSGCRVAGVSGASAGCR